MHRLLASVGRRTGTGLVLAMALTALAIASAAAATVTRTRIYTPFTSTGTVPAHVGKTVHGSCFTGSDAVAHKGAWRCSSANNLYDPCFSSAHAVGLVLCPASGPWSPSLVEIKLTKALPAKFGNTGKPSTKGLPWALQTTGGWKCRLATGATTVAAGKRLNYFCSGTKNDLWGSPIRTSQPWTIYVAPETAKTLTNRVAIKSAWF
jgi:hypothetical protein